MIEYKTTPHEYQREAIIKGIDILKAHGHLALAPVFMGAGKTLMSVYIALYLQYDQIVVICPKTLMTSWKDQIIEHTNVDMESIFFWDCSKSKTEKWKIGVAHWQYKNPRIIIINIEAYQTKNKNLVWLIDQLQIKNPKTIILLDESSKIKTCTASRTNRIVKETPKAWHRIILSGTPCANSILDLFSQYAFLKKDIWGFLVNNLKQGYYKYRYKYAVMIDERVSRDRVVKKVVGFKKLDELKSKIDYCTISLKKEDCADLPEKIEQEIIIDMSPEHRIFYLTFIKRLIGELDDATVSVTAAIEKYTRVRQICGGFFPSDETGEIRRVTPNAKLQTLMDDIDGTDEKIVIVCCYHEEVNFLYENFIEEFGKDSVVCYTGRQSIESRNANLENFKTKLETRFLILNPQTGSYGLNLQFCHIIYYYSIPNSSELFEQGKDRIHRQGQKEMCLYKYFLYRDSEDVKSKCRLDAKKDGAEKFYSKQDIKKYLLEELNGY